MATVEREFVSLESPTMPRAGAGGRPCQGVYYHEAGQRPRVAVIATHYEVDFSEHYLADLVAARGVGFLGWNTRYRGSGAYFRLEQAVTDIGVGVRWLREHGGIDTVVILGNSGGASLMGAYQSYALDRPDQLPSGDLFISLCAHPGRPDVLTAWLDPAVVDETDLLASDPSLDMFNKENGPPYDGKFVERYRAAQVARNDRISAWARDELDRLAAVGVPDRLFTLSRQWADLRFLDLSLDPSDRPIGCYAGDPAVANRGPFGLASTCTLRTWLDMWSLAESDCRGTRHLARITAPALVIQSTGDQGCFLSDARAIHDQLGSSDKHLHLVPGDHYLKEPSGARDDVATMVVDWINERAG
jgi:pimeloyl-ACP methyl ester carboxylesterase